MDLEPETKKCKYSDSAVELKANTDAENFTFPPYLDVSSMLDDLDFDYGFPSVTERYFTDYYRINVTKPGDDICIWIHSNRICMIGLAPSHNLLKAERIVNVNFKVSDKLDRTTNRVSGKSKHGAQPLQENSNLCAVTTSNNETHVIKCGMIGKLVEVNEALVQNAELLRNPPDKSGYLAIILLNIKLMDKMKKSMITRTEYENVLKQREDEQEL